MVEVLRTASPGRQVGESSREVLGSGEGGRVRFAWER